MDPSGGPSGLRSGRGQTTGSCQPGLPADYSSTREGAFDTISSKFPEYDKSPFVQERFMEDWSADKAWGWQQDRSVVGHNLKISWNLMRMNSLKFK